MFSSLQYDCAEAEVVAPDNDRAIVGKRIDHENLVVDNGVPDLIDFCLPVRERGKDSRHRSHPCIRVVRRFPGSA